MAKNSPFFISKQGGKTIDKRAVPFLFRVSDRRTPRQGRGPDFRRSARRHPDGRPHGTGGLRSAVHHRNGHGGGRDNDAGIRGHSEDCQGHREGYRLHQGEIRL